MDTTLEGGCKITQAGYQAEIDQASAHAQQAGPLAEVTRPPERGRRGDQSRRAGGPTRGAAAPGQRGQAGRRQGLRADHPGKAGRDARISSAEAERQEVELQANANAQRVRLEASAGAERVRLEATVRSESTKLIGEAEAAATSAKGRTEGDAVRARGMAEAEAIKARADALAENQDALIGQQLARNLLAGASGNGSRPTDPAAGEDRAAERQAVNRQAPRPDRPRSSGAPANLGEDGLVRQRLTREATGMRVAVTGSSGLIGSALIELLTGEGHQALRLVRGKPAGPDQARWDPQGGSIDADALATADAVVHLAGESIAASLVWTDRVKRRILASRVDGTRLLAETMAKLAGGASPAGPGPRVLLCASGVHFYGDGGDEILSETSPTGRGFLAEVCRQWEGAADPARAAGLRVAHLRTGVVLARHGGTLPRLALPFRLGLGARLGWSGRQWFSWIALDDVVGAYRHVLLHDGVSGPVNATAPNPVTNAELTATLAHVLGRPAFLRVPTWALRLALGQFAEELLFFSQRVRPAVLQASGYAFRHPELEPALRHVLGRPRAA